MHVRIETFQPKAIAYFPSTLTPYKSPGLPSIGWTLQAFWYSQDRAIPSACFGVLFIGFRLANELTYETFLKTAGSNPKLLSTRESLHRLRNGKTRKASKSTLEEYDKYYKQELPEFNQVGSFLQEMIENPLPQLSEIDGWYRLKK
jgi:hypothetical protein